MEIKNNPQQNTQSGFVLLMSLIVVSVLLSIGLSVVELSIKQVQLSTNARDSEIAFHAANAGMECSRYLRRSQSDSMEIGADISPTCFSVSAGNTSPSTLLSNSDGEVFLYDYEFTWGTTPFIRCTQVTTMVASSTLPGAGVTITNIPNSIPGYSNGTSRFCEAGTRCTIISVRGYNQPCTGVSSYGTVQREVLLEF